MFGLTQVIDKFVLVVININITNHRASTSTCWHFAFGTMLS